MSEERPGLPKGAMADPWHKLRELTHARVALGRAGTSLPTVAHLAFQLAHAEARDAVHTELDAEAMAGRVREAGLTCLVGHSAADDRGTYLQRPDLGRCLDQRSVACLNEWRQNHPCDSVDLAIVIADGLSARAVNDHALPMVRHLQALAQEEQWRLSPVVVAQQGRVAIGDHIGSLWSARMVVLLIGERPGLSSPDSLGVYLTYQPRPGLKDDARNCISNIRPEGLSYAMASHRLAGLLRAASERQLSGIRLKDDSELVAFDGGSPEIGNFLAPDEA